MKNVPCYRHRICGERSNISARSTKRRVYHTNQTDWYNVNVTAQLGQTTSQIYYRNESNKIKLKAQHG